MARNHLPDWEMASRSRLHCYSPTKPDDTTILCIYKENLDANIKRHSTCVDFASCHLIFISACCTFGHVQQLQTIFQSHHPSMQGSSSRFLATFRMSLSRQPILNAALSACYSFQLSVTIVRALSRHILAHVRMQAKKQQK